MLISTYVDEMTHELYKVLKDEKILASMLGIRQALFFNTDFRKKLKLETKNSKLKVKTQQIGRKFKKIIQRLKI